MKQSIRFVLVNTTHAGNIGATARAMKTMGFSELVLVNPCKYRTYDAYARASGANEIIDSARVTETLLEALDDCTLVFGTTARSRTLSCEQNTLREAAGSIAEYHNSEKIAFVFGRESSGLTNEELQLCHKRVHIPANPDFSSLNIASAVQLAAYELRQLSPFADLPMAIADKEEGKDLSATVADMNRFYTHLESVLVSLQFLDPSNPKLLMPRLRLLFNRVRLQASEVSILRGILSSIERGLSQQTDSREQK